ncbi:hypothetical protein FISHEDRAFT_31460, partial [Fistulina hepatica ATCC 64428]
PVYINPAQTIDIPPVAKQVTNSNKRKRTQTPDDATTDYESPQPRKTRDGPKKKKANRACFHCQKAHLTCDDSRPCQRCIKRGCAATCTEGHRKKAKYLLDEDELGMVFYRIILQYGLVTCPSQSNLSRTAPRMPEPFAPNDPMFNLTFDSNFPFGSEAANLEYSILSAILGNPSPPDSSDSTPSAPAPSLSWSSSGDPLANQSPRLSAAFNAFAENPLGLQPSDLPPEPSPFMSFSRKSPSQPSETASEISDATSQTPAATTAAPDLSANPEPLHPLQPRYPLDTRPRSPLPNFFFDKESSNQTTGLLTPPLSNSPRSTASVVAGDSMCRVSHLKSITDRVVAPYDYTAGWHDIMKYLPGRFEKNDILRIVRALAIFRPSLIALQMPLSWDDEVFVERCFQRSLIELEKLVSYSGTPTVVWRRTGEICLAAPEFCMLTEWSAEELVGKKKYIWELFENQSVVEYWENFASHAFENTTQSVYSHCVLLKPSGCPVPATCCFSIRRDLFDLPSIIIGQWLPLL